MGLFDLAGLLTEPELEQLLPDLAQFRGDLGRREFADILWKS